MRESKHAGCPDTIEGKMTNKRAYPHTNILLTWLLLQISDGWSLEILFLICNGIESVFSVLCQPKVVFSIPQDTQTLIKQSLSVPWAKRGRAQAHIFTGNTELEIIISLPKSLLKLHLSSRKTRMCINAASVLTETKVKQRPAPLCASCSVSSRGFASITDISVGRADCSSDTSFVALPSKP